MNKDIPEVNIKLESVEVKSEVKKIDLTVRNIFYRGVWGKLKTMWYYVIYHRGKTWEEYLDSKITYSIVEPKDISTYHDIDAEKELERLLTEELKEFVKGK